MTGARFFRARIVKGGPYVGVKTWFGPPVVDGEELDRSPRWQALVRTETTGRAILMGDQWPVELDGMDLRNIEAIAEAEYLLLVERAANSTVHDPVAAPWASVDIRRLPSIF